MAKIAWQPFMAYDINSTDELLTSLYWDCEDFGQKMDAYEGETLRIDFSNAYISDSNFKFFKRINDTIYNWVREFNYNAEEIGLKAEFEFVGWNRVIIRFYYKAI